MITIEWEPISTIWPDLEKTRLEEDCADKNHGQ